MLILRRGMEAAGFVIDVFTYGKGHHVDEGLN